MGPFCTSELIPLLDPLLPTFQVASGSFPQGRRQRGDGIGQSVWYSRL